MQKTRQINTSVLSPDKAGFPKRLEPLPQKIDKLYSASAMQLDNLLINPTVGIVGSRKISPYGRKVTELFAGELANRGVVVVSGLALGVDSIAHRSSLQNGGKTIAVLPSGLGAIYPSSHQGLARQILLNDGALITEYEKDEKPHKYYFIARNRIIAALSDVLIVTQAAEPSGSLYTAEFALEMGKTVFAVPGPIDNPTNQGTNKLLRSGASVALDPSDILEELGIKDDKTKKSEKFIPENEIQAKIISALNNGPLSASILLSKVGAETLLFQQQLTLLEIKGVIRSLGNNTWTTK